MRLTNDQIRQIADWHDRGVLPPGANSLAARHRQAFAELRKSKRWSFLVMDDGGMSDYYALAIYPFLGTELMPPDIRYEREAMAVYVSELLPVGVLGRTKVELTWEFDRAIPLDLDAIVPPLEGQDEIIDAVLAAFRGSGYTFLDIDAAKQPLPTGVVPHDYCRCAEPWDRVFHLLFANTD